MDRYEVIFTGDDERAPRGVVFTPLGYEDAVKLAAEFYAERPHRVQSGEPCRVQLAALVLEGNRRCGRPHEHYGVRL